MKLDNRPSILVVDDDPAVGMVLGALLEQAEIASVHAISATLGLELLQQRRFDVVITDLRMPDIDGMQMLDVVHRRWPRLPVVLLTAHGSVPLAVDAMKRGAADFVSKPFDRDELLFVLGKAIEAARRAKDSGASTLPFDGAIVGTSAAMQEVWALVDRVAPGQATVLLRGETGTGKEIVARAIHTRSPLAQKPFVKIDCASLPDNLLDSEIFGYERGAFTGAVTRKPGKIELAQGGTLFLDEIGEVTPQLQKKLLRILQDRQFERLGGTQTLEANVRFVAATHRDLERMVEAGELREDLFYRLNVVPVWLPPLRDRLEDVEALAAHFVRAAAKANGKRGEIRLERAAVERLRRHSWAGNVRELQHVIERMVVLAEGSSIGVGDADRALDSQRRPSSSPPPGLLASPPLVNAARLAAGDLRDSARPLETSVRAAEREALEAALKCANGNRTEAARALGVSRRTLHYKLKEHRIE